MTQFEFYQTVLLKVSFDQALFEKEYNKAMNELSLAERIMLKKWCKQIYSKKRKPEDQELYQPVSCLNKNMHFL